MKKLICTLLALAMCASMAACGGGEPAQSSAGTTTTAATTVETPATTTAPVTTEAPATTTAPTTTEAPVTTTAPTTTKPPVTEPIPTECSHNYKVSATTDATCTAKGSKTYTCSKCGNSYSEEIAMIAHNYADATCTEPKTCKICSATNGSSAGHKYTDATCTEPKTCKVCGATNGSAAGHKYTDTTCTAPKTCKVCKATEGSALGHSYSDGTCTRCGEADPNAPKVTYTMDAFTNLLPYEYDGEFGPVSNDGRIDYEVIVAQTAWYFFEEAMEYGIDYEYRNPDLYHELIVPETVFIEQVK